MSWSDWADGAASGWERQSDYQAQRNLFGSIWMTETVTDAWSEMRASGRDTSASMRVRVRGRQRQQVGGV